MSEDTPPSALERVYAGEAKERLRAYLSQAPAARAGLSIEHARNLEHATWLLEVLDASAPVEEDGTWAAEKRVRRHAWWVALDRYLRAADACGLLDANMTERLRSTEERNFRSARAECLVCWLLAERLGYAVAPVAGGGREGKQVEFAVTTPHGALRVEVKAPREAVPAGGHWSGDDSEALESCMRDAATQFGKGTQNLLVIVPQLRTNVYSERDQLVKLIGEHVIRIRFPNPGERRGRSENAFIPRGRFVRPGGKIAPDGTKLPAHTRVSAVMTVERGLVEIPEWDEGHRVLVLHNPFADCPISPETFSQFPQLVKVSDTNMAWTDLARDGTDDDE